MSCKVNTEITGGYGHGEENNESLNPEDLEQSVIMKMQDDNDRYKLYLHLITNTYQNLYSYLYCFYTKELIPISLNLMVKTFDILYLDYFISNIMNSLKYQSFTPSGCKDIGIGKFYFVAKLIFF